MSTSRSRWLGTMSHGSFSPIRLAYKGFLLCSKAMGELFRPARAPGSLGEPAPPGSLGLQSLVPRPKVKSQKCQKNPKCQTQHFFFALRAKSKNVKKNPKCQKHHKKNFLNAFCWRFLAKLSKAKQRKAKQSKAKHSIAKQSKAKLSKAKQSIAKQSKTKHSKAKQS